MEGFGERDIGYGARAPGLEDGFEGVFEAALRWDMGGTGAETPVTAEVMVAPWFQGGGDVERGEEVGVVILRVVVVPCEAGAVGEDGAARGDLVVVVDYESQVSHGFVAAVCRDLQVFGLRVLGCVDGVYTEVVLFAEGFEPGGIAVGFDSGYDEGRFRGFFEASADAAGRRENVRVRLVGDFSPWVCLGVFLEGRC